MSGLDVAAAREAAKPPNHPNGVAFVDGDMLLAACDEIERLREALREIAGESMEWTTPEGYRYRLSEGRAVAIARAALEDA